MLLPSLVVLLSLFFTAQSAAVPNTHVVHEKREITTSQWLKRDKLSSNAILPMRIGLKQQNLDRGPDFLMDVSHPESKNYAKHWTPEEIIDMFAPAQKTVDAVKEWLADFGIDAKRITHSDNNGWLALDATTAEAEGLLHAEYHYYQHTSKGHVTLACETYIYKPWHLTIIDINAVTLSRNTFKSMSTTLLPASSFLHQEKGAVISATSP
jgi:tripeptidyl-peptidase I